MISKNLNKLCLNFTLFLISSTFCLFLIEISSRLFWPDWKTLWHKQFVTFSEDLGTFTGVPGFQGKMKDLYGEYEVEIKLDLNGFRNNDSENPEILILGDSFAFGWGIEQSETFAQQLENISGKNVLNLGMPGADFIDYYLLAKSYGIKNSVKDVVLTVTVENDLRSYPEQFQPKHSLSNTSKALKLLFENSASCNVISGYLKRSNTFLAFGRKLNVFGASRDTEVEPGEPIPNSIAILKKIRELLLPAKLLVLPVAPRDGLKMEKLYSDFILALKENELDYIEVKEVQARFPLDGHWNQQGHRLAAETIAKNLLDSRDSLVFSQ